MNSIALLQIMLLWLCGMFNIVAAIYIFVGQKINTKRSSLMLEFLMVSTIYVFAEAGVVYFKGNTTPTAGYVVRIANFVVFCMHFVLALLLMRYMEYFVDRENAKMNVAWKIILYLLSAIGVVGLSISQFTGWIYTITADNVYQREQYFWTISVLALIVFIEMVLIILCHMKYMKPLEYAPLFILAAIQFATSVTQFFGYNRSLNTIGIGVATIIMFIYYEVERSNRLIEQEHLLMQQELEMARSQKLVAEQQKELTEQKTQIMLSQIKPHFMYNTLASIEAMCEIDPPKARRAIHTFSRYLRLNMQNLERTGMVTFDKELEYVDTYIWIEKMRFQERLNVEYDLQARHFEIPSLSVQPIVENAVKHGVCQLPDGGTVRISSWEEEDEYVIQIKDNGEGFDVEAVQSDGKLHIGLKNVRERLKGMCNGKMEVRSKIGEGTVVQLRIPIIKDEFIDTVAE